MHDGKWARWKAARQKGQSCACCKESQRFCWSCPCGFQICQTCMEENLWGMTCNSLTWICPDCGTDRSF